MRKAVDFLYWSACLLEFGGRFSGRVVGRVVVYGESGMVIMWGCGQIIASGKGQKICT